MHVLQYVVHAYTVATEMNPQLMCCMLPKSVVLHYANPYALMLQSYSIPATRSRVEMQT